MRTAAGESFPASTGPPRLAQHLAQARGPAAPRHAEGGGDLVEEHAQVGPASRGCVPGAGRAGAGISERRAPRAVTGITTGCPASATPSS
jgi:hypothetical protein